MTKRRLTKVSCTIVAILAAGLVGCSQPATENTDPVHISLIVFSAMDTNHRFQIYSVQPDGSDKKQLTDQGNNVTPSWTPDGKQIIFASDRSGTRELYRMNADGSGVSQIVIAVVGNKLTPNMSHDLSQIVFAAENPLTGHPEIWVVNADGTAPRQLTNTPKANTGPTWSLFPRFSLNDSHILYASTQSGSSQIWIMNNDGTGKQQLTNGVATDCPDANAPNWSPDGKSIVFWAGYETRYGEIWMMDADGTNPKQLTDQPAPISSDNPAWSPDGSAIIFDTNRSGSNVEIWIMNANGGEQRKLIEGFGAGGVMQMSWRPLMAQKDLPPDTVLQVPLARCGWLNPERWSAHCLAVWLWSYTSQL